MRPAAGGVRTDGGDLTRAGFLRHLAQEASRFVRAVRGGALTISVTGLGPAPQMRVVGAKPVYVWLVDGEPVARAGLCPRDGYPVYWRGEGTGSFFCPLCGPLGPGDLAPVAADRAGALVRIAPP